MTQTLRPHRDPYAVNPNYQANPNYAAPIPPVDPWSGRRGPQLPPHRPAPHPLPQRPMAQLPMIQQSHAPFAPQSAPQPLGNDFDIRPRQTSRRGLWIGLGVGAVLVAVIIALVVALISGGDSTSSSTTSSNLVPAGDLAPESTTKPAEPQGETEKPSTDADEEEIVELVQDFGAAVETRIQARTLQYYCAADRAVVQRSGSPNVIVPTENYDPTAIPTDIKVKGKRAKADLNGDLIKFLQEDGAWTICMTG